MLVVAVLFVALILWKKNKEVVAQSHKALGPPLKPLTPEEIQREKDKAGLCNNDVRWAHEQLTKDQRTMMLFSRMKPVEVICPHTGARKNTVGPYLVHLKKRGWKLAA